MPKYPDPSPPDADVPFIATIEDELGRLPTMPIARLRERYRVLFQDQPPSAFGPDLLRRSIAQHLQEKIYGGLSREAKRLLKQLIRTMSVSGMGRIETPRRIKPGSELVRAWAGKTHRVTVLEEGYAYAGKAYSSLSEIATSITGTRWNGPRFFGLRSKATKQASQAGTKARTPVRDAAEDQHRRGTPLVNQGDVIRPRRAATRSTEEIGV